ncbi:MAG: dTDP-4-dehydrorhamnose 3,5-epimerase [Bacteroidales bacterium]|jgi:dTDP-4-dehydrorhamnose 3,5-epimerase|nr:dTDP-4-dehydrorhamnose 3,5-epimerase [Bacteroidales bacterium]
MKIIETGIKDLFVIESQVFGDSRGYFSESWNKEIFRKNGIDFTPVQQNESSSCYGVIRGLHYQLNPFSQAKLVKVVLGEVLDVAVDLRKDSPTFGKHYSIILSSKNKKQFFIPKGFAHGFSVLSENAIFSYLCDNFYNPDLERGIKYNDEFLDINWQIPENEEIVSDKDKNNAIFLDAEKNF